MEIVNDLSHIMMLLVVIGGILSYQKSTFFFNVLFFQILYTSLMTVVLVVYREYHLNRGFEVNNLWLGNISLLIELSLIFFAFWSYFSTPWAKRGVLIAFLLFIGTYVLGIYQQGFWVKLNYADLTSCVLMSPILVYAYYQVAQEKNVPLRKSPEKLAILGMLIYFAGSVPFIAMWDYLITNSPKVLGYLYFGINISIAFIRYIFLGIAFWLIYKKPERQIISL